MSAGEAAGRKPPRWVIGFLRALERCGEVRAAAFVAGVDFTTAYARRKVHPEFGTAWDAALAVYEEADPSSREGSPSAAGTGEDLGEGSPARGMAALADFDGAVGVRAATEYAVSGAKLRRVGAGKWTAAAERRFFETLSATASARLAAIAAGVSPSAIYARRMKRPEFRAQWEASLDIGRARIEMSLVEAANKTFDGAMAEFPEAGTAGMPAVSVAEAIRIVRIHASKAEQQALQPAYSPNEVNEIRERLIGKIGRLRDRFTREQLEQGWTMDEAWDQLVPPGWVKGPDWAPPPPPPPLGPEEAMA